MKNGPVMKILVIDNYDSFTYNLVHFLGELGATGPVARNDKITLDEIAALAPEAIVISPGPCTPNEAGISLDLVTRFDGQIPIFGVCLGLQSIAQALGGTVIAAPSLMHGKVSPISHDGSGVFAGLSDNFKATRYHSLCVSPTDLPAELIVGATCADGVIMGLEHKGAPTHAVQFHPESIASEHGHEILRNFLNIAKKFNASRGG
ncbi:Anthranilate synthase, amidotransferase component [hydrothermal vent metagenome]|uniref:Anthranilate synthase, amidotransferase component n=1 Tax=hydrothermal vent metagenome TaxID=652676 RepID=A0A3B0UCR2_9ZZZZ